MQSAALSIGAHAVEDTMVGKIVVVAVVDRLGEQLGWVRNSWVVKLAPLRAGRSDIGPYSYLQRQPKTQRAQTTRSTILASLHRSQICF